MKEASDNKMSLVAEAAPSGSGFEFNGSDFAALTARRSAIGRNIVALQGSEAQQIHVSVPQFPNRRRQWKLQRGCVRWEESQSKTRAGGS